MKFSVFSAIPFIDAEELNKSDFYLEVINSIISSLTDENKELRVVYYPMKAVNVLSPYDIGNMYPFTSEYEESRGARFRVAVDPILVQKVTGMQGFIDEINRKSTAKIEVTDNHNKAFYSFKESVLKSIIKQIKKEMIIIPVQRSNLDYVRKKLNDFDFDFDSRILPYFEESKSCIDEEKMLLHCVTNKGEYKTLKIPSIKEIHSENEHFTDLMTPMRLTFIHTTITQYGNSNEDELSFLVDIEHGIFNIRGIAKHTSKWIREFYSSIFYKFSTDFKETERITEPI